MEFVNHIKRFFYMFYTQNKAIIDIFHLLDQKKISTLIKYNVS